MSLGRLDRFIVHMSCSDSFILFIQMFRRFRVGRLQGEGQAAPRQEWGFQTPDDLTVACFRPHDVGTGDTAPAQ